MQCISLRSSRTVRENQAKYGILCLAAGQSEALSASEKQSPFLCAKRNAHCYRILFLIDQLENLGGAERSLLRMVAYLRNKGTIVTVITLRGKVHRVAKLALGDCLLAIPITKTYGAGSLSAAWKISRIIRSQKIDIVQTFFETADIWGGLIARIAGVPILISSRRDMGTRRSWKHKIAYRLMNVMYDKVVTVSEAVRQNTILQEHLSPAKVMTIHNGTIYPTAKSSVENENILSVNNIPENARVIVSVANLLPWKGHHMFVRVASLLHQQFPDVHYVIVGALADRELLGEIKTAIHKENLDNHLHLLGSIENVEAVLSSASIFCLFSDSEGFPNSVIEAMAEGLPVVATNAGGSHEAVREGVTGYLVPVNDHVTAAERVARLLHSEELRRKFGEFGKRDYQSRFTMKKMMQNWMNLYELLIERSK